jgi:hypothetical protein
MDELRRSEFMPTLDGRLRLAAEALLIPDTVPNAWDAHQYLRLPNRTLLPEIEEDTRARDFARKFLGVDPMSIADALENPADARDEDPEGYYAFLMAWSVRHGRYHGDLLPALQKCACVRLKSGKWMSPNERVYFPRERADFDFPEGIRVPIADLPDLPHLRSLMEDLGVRSFDWRNLLTDYVLPPLTDEAADDEARRSSLELLARYFRSNGGGARALQEQIGRVLLPARDAGGHKQALQPANRCYFSSEWTRNDQLEVLYGPFANAEFLNVAAPAPGDEFRERYDFYRALGVQDRPRVLEAVAATKDLYKITGGRLPRRHPHRDPGDHWRSWQELDAVKKNLQCESGHAGSQQLKSSFQLDRFHELLERADPAQMTALWSLLSEHWGETYQPALSAVFRCQHGTHSGERERKAPSLFGHMLATAAWVPARLGSEKVLAVGSDVWRAGSDTPGHVGRTVSLLVPELDVALSVGLISTVGIVDAARPQPTELVALLALLADQHDPENSSEKSDACNAAGWAMRKLNEALLRDPLPEGAEVKLLARCGDRLVFVTDPVVANDRHLADSWSERLPVYHGDRQNRRLRDHLGLRRLEDLVTVTPDPIGRLPEERERVLTHFRARGAILAAVALHSASSRREGMMKHLRSLELDVCRKLVLRYEHDGHIIQREAATSYIAVRNEGPGNAKGKVGTAWLEIDSNTNRPDWFEFATHLAEYLDVPGHADAFALVLRSDSSVVEDFLASRQIDDATIEAIRVDLDRIDDAELLPRVLAGQLDHNEHKDSQRPEPEQALTLDFETPSTNGIESGAPPLEDSPQLDDDDDGEEAPLPDIDHRLVQLVELEPTALAEPAPRPPRASSKGDGGGGAVDFAAQHRTQMEHGERGEEAVYHYERRRLASLGRDPDAVVWKSQSNPTSPYDIGSISQDGQRIYIEVKATSSDDPYEPIAISQAELTFALQKGGHYHIYRVINVHTANPAIYTFSNLVDHLQSGRASLSISSAKLRFGRNEEEVRVPLLLSSLPPAAE